MSTYPYKSTLRTARPRPLVSVVVPTFNRAALTMEAVDSVLSQTYPLFELIVVNDGSRDETADRLSAYGQRIKTLHQANRGVSAARNAGIRAAQGDLVALLDSDDLWLPRKLETQVSFFLENPEVWICQTEEIWIRNGKRVNPKKKHAKPSGDIFERSLDLCLVSPSAVMMKKSLFTQVGFFDESLPACEDYDLWLRIACNHPVHLIDTPLIIKRGGHEDQLSRMPELDKYRIRSLVNLLLSGGLSKQQYAAAHAVLAQKCAIYANGCRKRGRITQADYFSRLPDKMTAWPSGDTN